MMKNLNYCFLFIVLLTTQRAFGVTNQEVVELSKQITGLLENSIDSINTAGKRQVYRSLLRTLQKIEDLGIDVDQNTNLRLVCSATGTFDRNIITRVSDGQTLGKYFNTPAECRAALNNQKGGLVCAPTGTFDRNVITKISDGQTLGKYFDTPAKCRNAVTKQRDGLVCAPTGTFDRNMITRISDGQTFGSYFDSAQLCYANL